MLGDKQYVCFLLAVILVVATVTTAVVLYLATFETSDSDTSSSFMAKHFHSQSDNSANVVLIVLDDAGWADFSHHNTDP